MDTCTLGVDIGTTSAKAVAFSASGRTVAIASRPIALLTPAVDAVEQDPHAVLTATNDAVAETVKAAKSAGFSVERLGFSAAMHSLIAIGADGVPLTNARIWMDNRANAVADALWASAAGKATYKRTGTPIHAMTPLPKLIQLRQSQPDLFARAAKFVSLKEWIWYAWFGEWQVDASIASATGLYNLLQGRWDTEAMALAGVSLAQLSSIMPTTYTRAGLRTPSLLAAGLTAATPCTIGASDGVLANLGVGAIGPEGMVLTIGTSCAVRTGAGRVNTDVDTRAFCYVLDRDKFVIGLPSNSGGIIIDWLYHHVMRNAGKGNVDVGVDQLIADAGKLPDSDLICLPYLTGERAPLWNTAAAASFVGMRLQHGPADLLRAAIEGILYNAYWMASGLYSSLGQPRYLIASGKVLEEEWIRQLAADLFGLPVIDASSIDSSALGAAMIADIAAGAKNWPGALAIDQLPPTTVVRPVQHDRAQARYQHFRAISAALLGA